MITGLAAKHTATLLPSGKVLVAGGKGSSSALASGEIYDPVSNAWTPAGSMSTGRYFHQAVLLASGQVLAVGGFEPTVTGQLASVDAYDAGTNSWSQAAAMNTSRDAHTATVLPSGQVLVAGGYGSNGGLASAELFAGAPNITSTISGLIADASNTPIVGVSVSYGAGDASITQSDGTYQISGLVPGSYTLMPSKPGYTFSPPSRAVTVPPDATGVDFAAMPTGSESRTGMVYLNEIMPRPAGQHQWVELFGLEHDTSSICPSW